MEKITMEIIEPYEKQGNDVIVNIRKVISVVGLPSKTESLFFRLEDYANAPDQQIREVAMARIREHLEKIPDES
jgi:hypothetical protein